MTNLGPWTVVFLVIICALLALVALFYYHRRQSKRQLRVLRKVNREMLTREKGHEEFVHMAVHELKSPVTVLKAYLQLAQLRFKNDERPEYTAFTEKMDVQLDKLLSLIADLLDGVKAGNGDFHYLMRQFNVDECLQECIEGIKAAYPQVTIVSHLGADVEIKGDRDRIGQVINNLISNAIKYSPKEKYIEIESQLRYKEVLIKVKDRGLGIPLEKQAHVFDRFYRVDHQLVKKQAGLGLGLYISSEIIKKHGGTIGLESKENEGSLFWFCLPLNN